MPTRLSPAVTRALARPRWTQADARLVLDAVAASGLSRAEFARTYDVDYQRLNTWRHRLAATSPPAPPVGFVQVVTPTASSSPSSARYEIQLASGEVLRVDGAVDVAMVRTLLDVVRAGRAC
jgi:hypothetical protein